MTIDPKYQTRALSVLTEEEMIREVKAEKVNFSLDLFKADYELAKSLDINVSRILRFKFHEWLQDKIK